MLDILDLIERLSVCCNGTSPERDLAIEFKTGGSGDTAASFFPSNSLFYSKPCTAILLGGLSANLTFRRPLKWLVYQYAQMIQN